MKKDVILISGPAGSGLSSAEFVFEELGYYVIKNMPVNALKTALIAIDENSVDKICLIFHSRNAKDAYYELKEMKDIYLRFIILNTSRETLLKRYALTRHVHPRSVIEKISPEEAIFSDVEDILKLIPECNFYIDTTSLTVKQLRNMLFEYVTGNNHNNLSITFISFGLKNGIPQGIDTFLDVRTIPNPYWVEELKELTGADQKVIDYMNSFPVTKEILDNFVNYLEKNFIEIRNSGRASYIVGVACSGGQHRSTYVANYLKDYFAKEYKTLVIHRDCESIN